MAKFALLIANDQYDDAHFAELVAPFQDVSSLGSILLAPGIGDFAEAAVLRNESWEVVQGKIAAFFHNRKKEDLVLLYFSGHGIVDVAGDLFFAVKNTKFDMPLGTAIGASFVREALQKSRSRRQVVILDCCHGGAFDRGTKRSATSLPALTEKTFEVEGFGREIITSSSATQISWDGAEKEGSIEPSPFTKYLAEGIVTGLAGPVGADSITIEDIYKYAYVRVVVERPQMRPQRWVDNQEGTFTLARNPKPRTWFDLLPETIQNGLRSEDEVKLLDAIKGLGEMAIAQGELKGKAAREVLKSIVHEKRGEQVNRARQELIKVDAERGALRKFRFSWIIPSVAVLGGLGYFGIASPALDLWPFELKKQGGPIPGTRAYCKTNPPTTIPAGPWKNADAAIVIDTFSGSKVNLEELKKSTALAAVIHKASEGLQLSKEYSERRATSKRLGFLWGSYHVGRKNGAEKEADFYLNAAQPDDDEVMALDIEGAPGFMNLHDAARFLARVYELKGRYPIIYLATGLDVTKLTAAEQKTLASAPLWFPSWGARYGAAPLGYEQKRFDPMRKIWPNYLLWQFSNETNCIFRIAGDDGGTNYNLFSGSIEQLRKSWPFSRP